MSDGLEVEGVAGQVGLEVGTPLGEPIDGFIAHAEWSGVDSKNTELDLQTTLPEIQQQADDISFSERFADMLQKDISEKEPEVEASDERTLANTGQGADFDPGPMA